MRPRRRKVPLISLRKIIYLRGPLIRMIPLRARNRPTLAERSRNAREVRALLLLLSFFLPLNRARRGAASRQEDLTPIPMYTVM
jgi:hypothetical protein